MQENWIGKSIGMRFGFKLAEPVGEHDGFEVFTTRPDTIFGASFAAISPDHPIALRLAEGDPALTAFIAECKAGGTTAAELETAEKWASTPALEVVASARSRRGSCRSMSPISC